MRRNERREESLQGSNGEEDMGDLLQIKFLLGTDLFNLPHLHSRGKDFAGKRVKAPMRKNIR
jgi:hypothetical protein